MTDDTTIRKAQAQMNKAALALAAMADDVAQAKQIKEYDSDRRKQLLSSCVTPLMQLGATATAAEHEARASELYRNAHKKIGEQYAEAMQRIEKAEAQKILWESARSLLSVEKAKIGMI